MFFQHLACKKNLLLRYKIKCQKQIDSKLPFHELVLQFHAHTRGLTYVKTTKVNFEYKRIIFFRSSSSSVCDDKLLSPCKATETR